MNKLSLLLFSWTLLALSADTPQVDIQATDYIAFYECKNGKLKLVWHSEDLEEEELRELKKEEDKPCKKQAH
ncbi:MAG: hypothetical protein GXO18_00975 [Aquificae bacterium]|nr:hypothetical protein [Aquificota bacterium]